MASSPFSMTPTAPPLKRRKAGEEGTPAEQIDHRKRRRNRTTQSCLNCHGSKRMCDRKRPACSRCVKLGLSGICVYEVDDINQKNQDKDETTHLKSRIAELEGFIREFKRKPHPRWAADLMKLAGECGREPDPSSSEVTPKAKEPELTAPTADNEDTPSPTFTATQSSSCGSVNSIPPTPTSAKDDSVILTSPAGFPFPAYDASRDVIVGSSYQPTLDTPSLFTSAKDIDSLLSLGSLPPSDANDVFDHVLFQILQCDAKPAARFRSSRCQCMQKSSAYSVVLELAPYVRRALDALNALPEHQNTISFGTCNYLKQLQELDATTSSLVESVSTSLSPPSSSYVSHMPSPLSSLPPSPNDAVPATLRLWSRSNLRDASVPIPSTISTASDEPSHASMGKERAVFPYNMPSSSADRFMSWEPRSAQSRWPKTVSL